MSIINDDIAENLYDKPLIKNKFMMKIGCISFIPLEILLKKSHLIKMSGMKKIVPS